MCFAQMAALAMGPGPEPIVTRQGPSNTRPLPKWGFCTRDGPGPHAKGSAGAASHGTSLKIWSPFYAQSEGSTISTPRSELLPALKKRLGTNGRAHTVNIEGRHAAVDLQHLGQRCGPLRPDFIVCGERQQEELRWEQGERNEDPQKTLRKKHKKNPQKKTENPPKNAKKTLFHF